MAHLQLYFSLFQALGVTLLYSKSSHFKKLINLSERTDFIKLITKILASFLLSFALVFFITQSLSIALPISLISAYLPQMYIQKKRRRIEEQRRKCWPLVVDQISSATQSGVPLHIALHEMQDRGPAPLVPLFVAFSNSFKREGSLEKGLTAFVESAHRLSLSGHDDMAVKIKSTVMVARDCGGLEVGPILRNLGNFLRLRERTENEIAIKQEWIKNGALLASITPWLLLVLLTFNSETRAAYENDGGRFVLLIGLGLTIVAYLWISRISQSVSFGGSS